MYMLFKSMDIYLTEEIKVNVFCYLDSHITEKEGENGYCYRIESWDHNDSPQISVLSLKYSTNIKKKKVYIANYKQDKISIK